MAMTKMMEQAVDYINMPLCSTKYIVGCEQNGYKVVTYKVAYANRGIQITKNLSGPKVTFMAEAGLFACNTDPKGATKPIEQVSAKFFNASVGAHQSSTSASAGARVSLVDADVSAFGLHLGAGVSTGGGIEDDSISVKALGCGFQVGRKIGISLFDNEISFDFGKLFG